MARHPLEDFLQVFPFWLADLGPIDTIGFPILNPLLGFASVTAPEITVELEEFKEGNFPFTRKVPKAATVNSITLTRGKTWYDSDFWAWTMNCVMGRSSEYSNVPLLSSIPGIGTGSSTYRRTLMLVHFFRGVEGRTVAERRNAGAFGGGEGDLVRSTLLGLGVGAVSGVFAGGSVALGTAALQTGIRALGINSFEFAARIPATIYILYNCFPTRYKTTSDFDANSGDVSIQELDLAVEYFEELTAAP